MAAHDSHDEGPAGKVMPSRIEERLGYRFRDPALLEQALTHSSFAHEAAAQSAGRAMASHYDRLEFLGDAAIGLLLAEHEFHAAPEASSGELSQSRAQRARRSSVAAAGHRLDLGRHARLSAGEKLQGGPMRLRLLADLYEAVVGAIYLDGGLEAAKSFVQRTLLSSDAEAPESLARDFKSELQEILQGEGKGAPLYRVVEQGGPPHAPMFLVEVVIQDLPAGQGIGGSKREAEQAAACVTIRDLKGRNN